MHICRKTIIGWFRNDMANTRFIDVTRSSGQQNNYQTEIHCECNISVIGIILKVTYDYIFLRHIF